MAASTYRLGGHAHSPHNGGPDAELRGANDDLRCEGAGTISDPCHRKGDGQCEHNDPKDQGSLPYWGERIPEILQTIEINWVRLGYTESTESLSSPNKSVYTPCYVSGSKD